MSEQNPRPPFPLEAGDSPVKRAEWIAIAAFVVSIAQFVFMAGVIYADVQDHDRRILVIETEVKTQSTTLTRIEAGVKFLEDRAREDRAAMADRR